MIKVMHVVYGGSGGTGRNILNLVKNYDLNYIKPSVVLVGYQIDQQYLSELDELRRKGIEGAAVMKNSRWDWGFCLKLRRVIAGQKPDILLLHTPVAYFWGRLAAPCLGIKHIVSVAHLAMLGYHGQLGRIINLLQTHLQTSRVVCISEAVKNVVQKELLLPIHRIRVIENGIPTDCYPPVNPSSLFSSETLRIKMISRLEQQKDPATLIRAVRLLKDSGRNIRLDFIGDGSQRPMLEALTLEMRLDDQVSFLGTRSDIAALLHDTDIFVLSTHGEGLPIALLEAMAAGLPCIATAVPGTIGVIEQMVSGILVPENDAAALGEAICFMAENPEMARSLAQSARQRVLEKYNIRRVVQDYQRLFEELLSSTAPNRFQVNADAE